MDRRKVIYGYDIATEVQIELDEARVLFEDSKNPDSYFYLNSEILSKHILLLGGAGCGKTNVFNLIVNQLRDGECDDSNDVYIVFDTKGDFEKNFGKPGDLVLGNSKAYRERSIHWNIFEEVLSGGTDPVEYEMSAREMAAALFEGRGSASQPFFVNSAREIFASGIILFIRLAEKNPKNRVFLDNKHLVDWFHDINKSDKKGTRLEKYKKYFGRYNDLSSVLSYLGSKGDGGQADGVIGELNGMLDNIFLGVFKAESEFGKTGFSMRNAVRAKGGKAIFVEYDLSVGETLGPMYRLLIDQALKEALGRSEDEGNKGNVYMVLDELKLLPKLQHLDDALNFGRSLGVKVIGGLQSIDQLNDMYGKDRALVICGGFGSLFAFMTGDASSREYITKLFGTNVVQYSFIGTDAMAEKREREGHVVETWDQLSLGPGEAFIKLNHRKAPGPFKFYFKRYVRK